MGIENTLLYLVSLPERLTRAIAAGAGGAIYESTRVLLPGWTARHAGIPDLYRPYAAHNGRVGG